MTTETRDELIDALRESLKPPRKRKSKAAETIERLTHELTEARAERDLARVRVREEINTRISQGNDLIRQRDEFKDENYRVRELLGCVEDDDDPVAAIRSLRTSLAAAEERAKAFGRCVDMLVAENVDTHADGAFWFAELAPNINTFGDVREIGRVREWRATLHFGHSLDELYAGWNYFGSSPDGAATAMLAALSAPDSPLRNRPAELLGLTSDVTAVGKGE